MRNILVLLVALILCSCNNENKSKTLKAGNYRVVLAVQDNEELPFNIEVTSSNTLKIFNAEEVIEVDEIQYRNDSIFIMAPVFEGYFAGVLRVII